jgi:23S rRNA pseudouridine1911/1915/1917 synthase
LRLLALEVFEAAGEPVLGDTQYGSTRSPFPEEQRIALHAHSLTFQHPVRYDPLTITAPLPDDWPMTNDQ